MAWDIDCQNEANLGEKRCFSRRRQGAKKTSEWLGSSTAPCRLSKRSQLGGDGCFSRRRQGRKENFRTTGILDGAMPAAIGFVGRLVQVAAFCSGWTPEMGSFGNFISVRSLTSPGGHDAESALIHRIQRGFSARNGNSFIINGKNPESRVTEVCRVIEWGLLLLWVVFSLITFGEYGFLPGWRSITVDYAG